MEEDLAELRTENRKLKDELVAKNHDIEELRTQNAMKDTEIEDLKAKICEYSITQEVML